MALSCSCWDKSELTTSATANFSKNDVIVHAPFACCTSFVGLPTRARGAGAGAAARVASRLEEAVAAGCRSCCCSVGLGVQYAAPVRCFSDTTIFCFPYTLHRAWRGLPLLGQFLRWHVSIGCSVCACPLRRARQRGRVKVAWQLDGTLTQHCAAAHDTVAEPTNFDHGAAPQ